MRAAMCLWISLLIFGCAQADSLQSYPIKPRIISDYISIDTGVHPIRLPLVFMKNSKLYGDNGLIVKLSKTKAISINNHTESEWKPILNKTNQIPEIIFKGNFEQLSDEAFKKQLIVTRENLIDQNDITNIGYVRHKEISAYIAISSKRKKSVIFLMSEKYSDMFTQIGTSGLSKKEIEDNIIQGILQ